MKQFIFFKLLPKESVFLLLITTSVPPAWFSPFLKSEDDQHFFDWGIHILAPATNFSYKRRRDFVNKGPELNFGIQRTMTGIKLTC